MDLLDSTITDPTDRTTAPINNCNACGAAQWTAFFRIPRLPVHVGVFFDDPESARQAPVGEIELAFCQHCGHVFNRCFDPQRVQYLPGYEVALHHSPTFRNFMMTVANRLIDKYDLRQKRILEIGAGCAWFLELLCRLGGNDTVGIDPTISNPGKRQLDGHCIELIRQRFDADFAERFTAIDPDFVCCLSVLEHIASPSGLVAALRSMIDDKKVAIYFEIFNAFRAFQQQEIWSVHYEQCNYFSEQSFATLFKRNGFRLLECGPCYDGGQYLFVDAITDPDTCESSSLFATTPALSLPSEIASFSQRFNERLTFWNSRLDEFRHDQKRVVFWGSGGKGVSFLNLLPTAGTIEFVAEINPAKQGKYVPGSAQKIVSPESLAEYQPDVVILSNALYEDEIRHQAQQLGLRCDFYVA